MRERIKIFLNRLIGFLGYRVSKFDRSGYMFRDDMYKMVKEKYGFNIKGRVLDVGASLGSWAQETFSKQAEVVTIDNREGSDVVGDVLSLPFPDNSFDCVFCFETIEHVKNPFTAVSEIHRVLKPGGIFIGSTPFMYELHGEEYGDYWRLTRQAWELLLKDFKETEIYQLGREKMKPHHYIVKGIK